jgi:hypothetical protein
VICIVTALVLLGAGVGIGAAAFGTDHPRPVQRFVRPGPGYDRQGPLAGRPGYPNGPRQRRHLPDSPAPTPSPRPSTGS